MSMYSLETSSRLAAAMKLQYRDVLRFLEGLQWSLNHIAGSVRIYAALAKLAPGEAEAEELERLLLQAKGHFALVRELYVELKGMEPKIEPAGTSAVSYREGLREAIGMEREAIRQFRDTYLLTPSPRVRDVFFLAMSDGVDRLAALFLLKQEA
ncbi:hypothetical protein [Paenibacillus mucilaginosus]|uniref:Uncharacterized protein n=3 Tax=Paenibacillus mucilaginosus TaxID=61624 RepID=H6NR85_9BACL|nr:hypothetical protein [Paenibacillus mucilaginosus]AEI45048.1 hypothetical protein KNP414_06527 [Paenibacillus mucilaginosus KNP414]AFC32778.1 hypothetical protein PM3016_6135 [Paenibacillus mucilaginosus 3016]AFH65114.1 hypothetical protein B2K_31150 [Paenibacillus mucilaginosus K02]MCG7213049.1 hypothetical protein [Paenibacillus mucilaginosus]WDM26545.1 hypothetical protein KCX80_29625 [Paenibacillus mucilaginosus]